jgi:hypothetical protein
MPVISTLNHLELLHLIVPLTALPIAQLWSANETHSQCTMLRSFSAPVVIHAFFSFFLFAMIYSHKTL